MKSIVWWREAEWRRHAHTLISTEICMFHTLPHTNTTHIACPTMANSIYIVMLIHIPFNALYKMKTNKIGRKEAKKQRYRKIRTRANTRRDKLISSSVDNRIQIHVSHGARFSCRRTFHRIAKIITIFISTPNCQLNDRALHSCTVAFNEFA